MRVEVLIPDGPAGPSNAAPAASGGFGALVDAAGAGLDRADAADRAFVERRGGMLEMVVERARADVALQIAATAAQRTAQAVQTVFGIAV